MTTLSLGKRTLGLVKTHGFTAMAFGIWSCGGISQAATLGIGNTPGYPGTTVFVPVLAKATNVVAAQFDVAFNPSKVSMSGPRFTGAFSDHVVRSREVAPGVRGVRRVLVYSLANPEITLTNSRVIANVPFTVAATEYVGSGPISPENVILARRNGTLIEPVSLSSGQIFVRPVNLQADGSAQFFLPSEPDTRYLIQATTNFVRWVNIANSFAVGNFLDLVDQDAKFYPYRFYRSVLYEAAGEIGGIHVTSGGEIIFELQGLEGRTYTLQSSTNLRDWVDLETYTASGSTISITNLLDFNYPTRFFRFQSR